MDDFNLSEYSGRNSVGATQLYKKHYCPELHLINWLSYFVK